MPDEKDMLGQAAAVYLRKSRMKDVFDDKFLNLMTLLDVTVK